MKLRYLAVLIAALFCSVCLAAEPALESFTLVDRIGELVMYGLAVVGGASMVVQGLATIAKVTPSQKDDYYISKAERFLIWLQTFLDRLALNLPSHKARKQ